MESWEGLDIDENDIGSYVWRCNSTTNVIPGPAGNVQAVTLNRNSDQQVNTQEFINRIGQQTYERDFTSNQWKWAEKFLQFQSNTQSRFLEWNNKILCLMMFSFYCEGEIDGRGSQQRSFLGSLKELDVFPLLSCLIKSCKHSGLGDMLITIKVTYVLCSLSYILQKKLYIKFLALPDPTGTASASVHGKVLKNEEFGSLIEVGYVLVLKNVLMHEKQTFLLQFHMSCHSYKYFCVFFRLAFSVQIEGTSTLISLLTTLSRYVVKQHKCNTTVEVKIIMVFFTLHYMLEIKLSFM